MPAQRKIFRIENSAPLDLRGVIPAAVTDDEAALRHHELMSELVALRALLDQRSQGAPPAIESGREQISQAQDLKHELDLIHEAIRRTKRDVGCFEANAFIGPQMARVGRELDAVIAGTEQATQNILKSAEDIDQITSALTGMLKGAYEQGLAEDVRDQVVKIFEACNFQDLTGQRIAKVIETLKYIEDHINRMLEIWRRLDPLVPAPPVVPGVNPDAKFLNGPKLTGDSGHSSQADIDIIFDAS